MEATLVAELCARKYYGGDISADAGLEIQDFEKAVQSAYALKIRIDCRETFRMTGERTVNPAWLVQYENVAVLFNKNSDSYYSVLPAQILGLTSNAGITITPTKSFQNPFFPQSLGESFLFMSNPQDCITFHYDKTNVYYDNFDPAIEKVFMEFPPLNAVDIPDEFVWEIRELVMRHFEGKIELNDKISDNNVNNNEIAQSKFK